MMLPILLLCRESTLHIFFTISLIGSSSPIPVSAIATLGRMTTAVEPGTARRETQFCEANPIRKTDTRSPHRSGSAKRIFQANPTANNSLVTEVLAAFDLRARGAAYVPRP